jgi:hypothetical protein
MRKLPAIESFGSSAEEGPEGVELARIEPKSVLG